MKKSSAHPSRKTASLSMTIPGDRHRIHYRLCPATNTPRESYLLTVRYRREEITVTVPSPYEEAIRIFHMVSAGLVTPCTLPDIAEDLFPPVLP